MEYRNPKDLTPHPTSIALYGDNHIDDLLESIKEYGNINSTHTFDSWK